MNDRRNHQMACGADESMYVPGEQRRSLQTKPCHDSAAFTLLPPRPRTSGEARLFSRDAQPSGLQGNHVWLHFWCIFSVVNCMYGQMLIWHVPVLVQGFCCPLRERPSSGRVTHKVTPQSRGEGEEALLSSLKGELETRAKPATRSRRPEMISHCEVPTVRKYQGERISQYGTHHCKHWNSIWTLRILSLSRSCDL